MTNSNSNPSERPPAASRPGPPSLTWMSLLNRYHWFVLLVAALGWLFDTMDQQLFALARTPAMKELLVTYQTTAAGIVEAIPAQDDDVKYYGTICTSIFLIGWAVGGLLFGVLGDRWGRARVMLLTIVVYSLCTGLSALSVGVWDFAFYRFLTGLGVGGEFAVGVALVAEVMPPLARPYALGLLQASSTIGNTMGALVSMFLGYVEGQGGFEGLTVIDHQVTPWRVMFLVGTLPALLALVIRRRLKEPETWQALKRDQALSGKRLGSYRELFGHPRWRRNALVGLAMGCAGIIGLWGIGFFSYDLFSGVARARFESQGLEGNELNSQVAFWVGMTSIMLNAGGFFGMFLFSYWANWMGRRPAFAIAYVAAMLSTALVFAFLNDFNQIFWMIPLMGFCQFTLFGGYAVYFPELFPTHLRSTGTSFCYNVGRILAAVGPFLLGLLTKYVYTEANGYDEGFRWAAVTMCSAFLIGLLALPFAPETKDQPLPE